RVNPGHFDNLFASLVHAFRNAVDHGIETVEVRKERGKPESGKIKVSAREFDNKGRRWVRLNIEDDGGGIDPAIIRAKLCEKFPGQKFEHMSEHDVLQGLFMPGFSSREAVGQFSGRGIGMDAIKTEVERLGGRAWIESELGRGSLLTLEFPQASASEVFAKTA
ncbi:MAG: ATP-binding protein, partial [Bdellovibrionales bacterium]